MTIQTLLIPTDGSDAAERAARRGFDLAEAFDAAVYVLSVADSSIATGAGYSGDSASIRNRLREQATVRAESLREEAADRGLDATAAIREGIPAEEIVDYADEHELDAIVIGTSGRGGVVRAIIGSVADKVVRTASVPVVTITPEATRAGRTASIGSLLVPTDGSETAMKAVERSLELAEQVGATLHLLSVVDDDLASALAAVTEDGSDPSSGLRKRSTGSLDALAADARSRGLEVVTATTSGTPADEIVDYAETNGVDAIVMGTHGRGGFERLLIGSVTDSVVRTATIPVCTVRPSGVETHTSALEDDEQN